MNLPRKEYDENGKYFWLPSVDMWKSLVKPFDQIVKVLTAPTNHRESCVWSVVLVAYYSQKYFSIHIPVK